MVATRLPRRSFCCSPLALERLATATAAAAELSSAHAHDGLRSRSWRCSGRGCCAGQRGSLAAGAFCSATACQRGNGGGRGHERRLNESSQIDVERVRTYKKISRTSQRKGIGDPDSFFTYGPRLFCYKYIEICREIRPSPRPGEGRFCTPRNTPNHENAFFLELRTSTQTPGRPLGQARPPLSEWFQ